jgi:predicted GNAT family N-acyltransferase
MAEVYLVDEELEPGLRYTEEFSRTVRSFSMGDYLLWTVEGKEYIGGLNVIFFRQRIGGVAVPSAGIGGVETVPAYRRQGYARKLVTRALESIRQRVPVVYLSDAIAGLYERYGFVNCLAESCLEIDVRDVERSGRGTTTPVQRFLKADLPPATLAELIALYNRVHALRSWTHERQATWNQLHETELWQPGSEVLVVECEGRLVGYAILGEQLYGRTPSGLVVDELAARDVAAAHALLAKIAARCWDLRLASFQVREPADSAAGQAARQVGCAVHRTYASGRGWMGAILDRDELLTMLQPELQRRVGGALLKTDRATAFRALVRGDIVPDNGVLLRLLTGHWSWADAVALGLEVPSQLERLCTLWFPGGGTSHLPLPHRHVLDSY